MRAIAIPAFAVLLSGLSLSSCAASSAPPACSSDALNPNQAIGAWLAARAACGVEAYSDPPWGPAHWVEASCALELEAADCAELEEAGARCAVCEAP